MSFQDDHSRFQKEIDRRVKQRVLDGIELLKKKWGDDWVDHIDLDEFDLQDGSSCVLGQLYGGNYVNGLNALNINGKGGLYAFDDDGIGDLDGFTEDVWDDFETVWRQQIAALQAERGREVSPV